MALPEESRHLQLLLDALHAGDQKAIRKALRAVADIETANRIPALDLFSEVFVEDYGFESKVLNALTEAGADAVPLLTVALRHRATEARYVAVDVLLRMGAVGVSGLIAGVKSRRVDVSRNAVRALRELGPVAKDAVRSLVEANEDVTLELKNDANERYFGDYRALRIEIVEALTAIGPAAAEAVPLLRSLLKKGGTIGYYSALALGEIGLAAREAIPDLLDITLHDAARDPSRRLAAAASLEKIGSTEGMAVALKETPTEVEALKVLRWLKLFYLVFRLYSEGATSLRNANKLVETHLFSEFAKDDLALSNVSFRDAIRDTEPFFRRLLGKKDVHFLKRAKRHTAFVFTDDAQAAWDWTDRFLHRHLKDDWFGFSRLLPETATRMVKKDKDGREKAD